MRFAEREAKPRGEGWRDMRLSRNRGNARGPTRLTNPLHRATSCRTRARSLARSLARSPVLPPNPPLPYSSFPFPRRRESLFFSLRLSAIPPTFSSFLRSSCLLPARSFPPPAPPSAPAFLPFVLHSPRASSALDAFFPPFPLPQSTHRPYSSSATPSSPSLLPRLLFCLCPPLYVPRSPPPAPIEYHPSQRARSILPHPPLISSSASTIRPSLSVAHARLECSCHLCY